MLRIPWNKVYWPASIFLIGTALIAVTAVPLYIWHYGLELYQLVLFALFFLATGLSITLGYHRLFTHRSFKAAWPVRLFTLIFGAASFENSVLIWASDHRQHHKFVDEDEDPYDISRGFFWAHIGWMLFKLQPDPPLRFVNDLRKDKLVMWQHNHYVPIALLAGFGLPTLLGGIFGGWIGALGGFLIPGVARIVCVQQFTFFINSLCHSIGRQPYASDCSARDSAIMAFFTFGEGYHNFHHTFQHDYRNGVKPWQFDPTKWSIWVLSKLGLAHDLRQVPEERIIYSQIAEKERQLAAQLARRNVPAESLTRLETARRRLEEAYRQWEEIEAEYSKAINQKLQSSREKLAQLNHSFREARESYRHAIRDWYEAHQLVSTGLLAEGVS